MYISSSRFKIGGVGGNDGQIIFSLDDIRAIEKEFGNTGRFVLEKIIANCTDGNIALGVREVYGLVYYASDGTIIAVALPCPPYCGDGWKLEDAIFVQMN